MRHLFLSIILLIPFKIFSQICGPLEWQRCYGGSLDDIGYSITSTSDGGFFFAGCTGSIDSDVVCLVDCDVELHGSNCDYWYAKIDGDGNFQWRCNPGGTASDVARASFQTPDGGYVVAGGSASNDIDVHGNHGDFDFWVLRLNSAGDTMWKKSYGGAGYEDFGSSTNTSDGNLILCGGSTSTNGDVAGHISGTDYWLLKISTTGQILWSNCFGSTGYDNAVNVTPTLDGGYMIAGFTDSQSGQVTGNHSADLDGWVVKTDANGIFQWGKCYGGTGQDGLYHVLQLSDSSYVFAGYTYSNDYDISGYNDSMDAWLMKTDVNGNIIWSKAFGGKRDEAFSTVQQDVFGNLVVGGYSKSNDGDLSINYGEWDYWVLNVDTAGDILCDTVYGGKDNDVCNALAATPDGGIVMIGYTSSDDGDVTDNNGKKDYWVTRIQGTVGIPTVKTSELKIVPTLAHDAIQISRMPKEELYISIWSVTGLNVYSGYIKGKSIMDVDISALPSGMYAIQVSGSYEKLFGKFVKQ